MSAHASDHDRVAILVVDDRPEDRLALAALLEGGDCDIVAADSGRGALRCILDREFAVILLDVVMPDMDGFEVASLVKQRERTRWTPIIFLTAAQAEVDHIYRAYAAGGVDYLTKPIDRHIVRAKVDIFVNMFRKDQRIRQQTEALLEADRRAKELELERIRLEGERRYRNLAEAIPQIVWTADPNGNLRYVNQHWCNYSGLAERELQGGSWLGTVHRDDVDACQERWRESLARAEVYEQELRLRRHDGVYRWHLSRAVPERGEDGRIVRWLGTCADCEDLKQAIHARDEFLLVASHELRTPLSVLQLQLEMLQKSFHRRSREDVERGTAERLDRAVRQTGRLHRLIENLLDVARLTAGRLTLEPEEIDLSQIVRDVVERFAEDVGRAGSRVELHTSTPVRGWWDRLRVEQVVTNLLSNALKYAPGKPVEIAVEADAESATLSVLDHGGGVSPQDLTRIFGRFERAVPARYNSGLGIGLYVTRQIVEAHGGAVSATNQPGAGARFTVTWPRHALEPAAGSVPRLVVG